MSNCANGAPVLRTARRWSRRMLSIAWRIVRIVLIGFAAMGPNAPPPPPRPPPPIEIRVDEGESLEREQG
ncbi:hypothetical protein LVJ94_01940 [Pendulispora rubella]|uniref:Uncharacterized protein n=1 Tax=Pendulispora rubella TaxID=2741070 RepID=A0ABZ2L6P3_9BACT